jgi:hypothetical protein
VAGGQPGVAVRINITIGWLRETLLDSDMSQDTNVTSNSGVSRADVVDCDSGLVWRDSGLVGRDNGRFFVHADSNPKDVPQFAQSRPVRAQISRVLEI